VKKLLLILSIFLSLKSYSGNISNKIIPKDSNAISYYYLSDIDSLSSVDTSFSSFYRYHPLYNEMSFFTSLGNIGTPYKNLLFNMDNELGFDLGLHSMDEFLYSQEDVKFYDHFRPYTELKYVSGSAKEQLFRVIHTHRLSKNIIVGLNYNLINSKGFFPNQGTNISNFYLTLQYKTSNNKYGILADYIHNKNKINENGGLKAGSALEEDFNMQNSFNRFKESGFQITQYLNFFRKINKNDTSNKQKINSWRLSHTFEYMRYSKVYSDVNADTNFYKKIYLDTLPTYDSIQFYKIENELKLYQPTKKNLVNFYFSLKHQYITYSNFSDSTTFRKKIYNQLIPAIGICSDIRKSIVLKLNMQYVLGDYNNNDNKNDAELLLKLSKKPEIIHRFVISVSQSNSAQGIIFNNYYSNHFKWENNFNKTNIIKGTFEYQYNSLKTGVNYTHLNGYVYFDSLCTPRQSSKAVNVFSAFIYKNFKFGRHVCFDNKLVYQDVDRSEVLRLPQFMSFQSLYFTMKLFKVLDFVVGADVTYNKGYYADAYMPDISSFYIQNKVKLKDYICANIFLNAKLKRATFFLTLGHFNTMFFKQNEYDYQVPSYPFPSFSSQFYSVRFGISWRFYD